MNGPVNAVMNAFIDLSQPEQEVIIAQIIDHAHDNVSFNSDEHFSKKNISPENITRHCDFIQIIYP
jgi:hypothetical protein